MAKQTSQRKARTPAGRPAVAAVPQARSGMLELATGHRIYFEDSGGSGPVLFYLYGLACSIAHWKYQLAFFADRAPEPAEGAGADKSSAPYRQVWFDFRGHGRSSSLPPGEQLSMRTIVEDVVALATHLGIREATFLGQSMGGSLVLQLARDYPQLVKSLVLLASPVRDPSPSLPMQPLSAWIWRGVVEVHQRLPHAIKYANNLSYLMRAYPALALPLRELIRVKGFNPNLAQTADVDEYMQKMLGVDARLFAALVAELTHFDAVRFADRITCPVLIIAGAHDLVVPLSESRRLLRHLPNGQLAIIPHGSHCPHFDDAPLVNRILSDFLAAPGGLQLTAGHER